jgi:hypothetical protein
MPEGIVCAEYEMRKTAVHKDRWITLAIFAGLALVVNACGSGELPGTGADGSAGLSGAGGTGGSAGAADAGATGGSAGNVATGGAGGSAGKAGSGGAAGSAGNGGSSGATIDGGMGGGAGTADSGGTGGQGGAAGTSDGGPDGTTGADASRDTSGDARSETSSDVRTGLPCSMGPAEDRACDDYCSDWFDACQPIAMWATTYADEPACLSACGTWLDAKLCCRAEHAELAADANDMTEASMHCGHAVGVNGPAACN